MFRKVLQSMWKNGRGVLDGKIRLSQTQVIKVRSAYKFNQNACHHVAERSSHTGLGLPWLRKFLKNLPSGAIAFAHSQRVAVEQLRSYNPLFRFSRRSGVSSSLLAFVAFNINLSEQTRDVSTHINYDQICQTIKEGVELQEEICDCTSLSDCHQLSIQNLDFGELISKGSDAAVHKAKKVEPVHCEGNERNASPLQVEIDEDNYDLAVKVMYNFEFESNADVIMRGMKKELIPLQSVNQQKESTWNALFRYFSEPQCTTGLEPHPNIIKIEEVFVDDVQELAGCHEEYPASLPPSVNANGFGRNKTLYIVMKRFPFTLEEYVHIHREAVCQNWRNSVLLFSQLLEGVLHMQTSNVAHRDIKSNNILIELNNSLPHLVITDFGCCFEGNNNLMTRYENDIVDKGGNAALMAPEIACARPGPGQFLDYNKSDLWAAGAVAYEIFGMENPFYSYFSTRRAGLRNDCYHDCELPDLPDYVPGYLNNLVKSVLRRDPAKRPDTLAVCNALHVLLWAPQDWLASLDRGEERPNHVEVMRWVLVLTAAYILDKSQSVEHSLKGLFLRRLNLECILEAIDLLWDNAG